MNTIDRIRDLLFVKRPRYCTRECSGDSGQVLSGDAASRKKPQVSREEWLHEHTLIVGWNSHDKETTVQWHLEFLPSDIQRSECGHLIVACDRVQGGLHSSKWGTHSRVVMNECPVDVIGLKTRPQEHDDFFFRPMLAPGVLELLRQTGHEWSNSVSASGTIYAWPISSAYLDHKGTQTVVIGVEPEVAWDIDHVCLILQMPVYVLKPIIREVALYVLGGISGVLLAWLLG
ncbi:MAG: hypothetical protein NT025_04020 [bacterium]|nr:hypothetical protein [bacterium]